MFGRSEPRGPWMRGSDGATGDDLNLARRREPALERALRHTTLEAGRVAAAGDLYVGYAVEAAEALYIMRGDKLVWEEPEEENVHLEISVRDGADGRFVPGLTVTVSLYDDEGRVIGTYLQPFLWYPWLYHYGRNWQVPGNGSYSLHVYIDPADFPRHDNDYGSRYSQPIAVAFEGVNIKTGRK